MINICVCVGTRGLRTLVTTFQASFRIVSLSGSGGSAQARLRPREPNSRCWGGDDVIVCEKLVQRIDGADSFSGHLTLGKPASSQSLIMPMKSVARTATNSGLNALMTEFNSKALWETNTQLQPLTILGTSE